MNYFAHGQDALDDPSFLAGTAVPDWLGAADRRARLRRERIAVDTPLARGVLRHLDDDLWFHRTHAFQATSAELTGILRAAAPDDPRFRAGFWGHVLTEILLDAHLIDQAPTALDRYYAALDGIDADAVARAVAAWTTRPPERLAEFIRRFRDTRFLYGYGTDPRLRRRLDGLARRVGLPALPGAVDELLPDARRLVADRAGELLKET